MGRADMEALLLAQGKEYYPQSSPKFLQEHRGRGIYRVESRRWEHPESPSTGSDSGSRGGVG